MRKIAVLTLTSLLLPALVLAAVTPPTQCTLKEDITDIDPACKKGETVSIEQYGACCLVNTLYVVTTWLFAIIMVIVGIMIIIGAFSIITAGGSPEKVTSGRNLILYAVIGMVVAWFAKAIPGIAKMLIGGV
jgi:hypothetical protein